MLSTISVLAFAVAAQAAPAALVGSKQFSAPAVHNANFQRNGTLAMVRVFGFLSSYIRMFGSSKDRRDSSSAPSETCYSSQQISS